MERNLNWAVLGCGVIANEMATALQNMGKQLYAVGNRTQEKAVAFAEKYGVEKVYEDYHQMFTDEAVDIIYITTPHNTHIEFAREALKNGKHVLCEKAVTLNSEELEEALELAEQNHVIFAEAMTVYHMPLYKKLWEYVRLGESGTFDGVNEFEGKLPPLGKVQLLQLNFGSYKEYDMENRFFNMNLAGGALLDIGVYALSLMRSFLSSQPDQVLSQVRFAETGADEMSGILLRNPDGQMATVTLSLHSKQPKRAVISCERGYIEITEYPRADRAVIVEAETGKKYELTAGHTADALQYEMEDMEKAVLTGNTKDLHIADTKDVMALMTALRKEWNMKYPEEERRCHN